MGNKEVIFIDLETYKNFYHKPEEQSVYRVSTRDGLLPDSYVFKFDNSEDRCEHCALIPYAEQCKTCFDCFNYSAMRLNASQNQSQPQNQEEKKPMDKQWENALQKIEVQIQELEAEIEEKTSEVKAMKKDLSGLYNQLRQTVEVGSEEYIKNHPLFEGIE